MSSNYKVNVGRYEELRAGCEAASATVSRARRALFSAEDAAREAFNVVGDFIADEAARSLGHEDFDAYCKAVLPPNVYPDDGVYYNCIVVEPARERRLGKWKGTPERRIKANVSIRSDHGWVEVERAADGQRLRVNREANPWVEEVEKAANDYSEALRAVRAALKGE